MKELMCRMKRGNKVVWKRAETSHDTYTGGFNAASVRNKVP